MDKKFKSVLLLSFLLMLLFVPMVSAYRGSRCAQYGYNDCGSGMKCVDNKCVTIAQYQRMLQEKRGNEAIGGTIGSGLKSMAVWVFGWHVVDLEIRWILSYLIIFVMLAVAFSDIIALFGVWEKENTSKVLGIGLAGIVALSGVLSKLVVSIFGLVALYGVIAVTMGIVLAFTAWIFLHVALFKNLSEWIKTKAEGTKVADLVGDVESGIDILKSVGQKGKGKKQKGFPWWRLGMAIGAVLALILLIAYFLGQ